MIEPKYIGAQADERTRQQLDDLCRIHQRTRSDELRWLIAQEYERARLDGTLADKAEVKPCSS